MNNKVNLFFIFSVVIALFLGIMIYPALSFAMRGANITVKRAQGQNILLCIEHGKENSPPRWSYDIGRTTNFINSSDYFNWLKADSDSKVLQRISSFQTEGKKFDFFLLQGHDFTKDNNMWMVVKNIPTNAPDNIIVLATRNVEPSSLPIQLSAQKETRRILYHNDSLLKNIIILIRKDGTVWTGRHSPCYEEVCGSVPFDLTTNLVNGLPVKYLTPTGEVTPTNE